MDISFEVFKSETGDWIAEAVKGEFAIIASAIGNNPEEALKNCLEIMPE